MPLLISLLAALLTFIAPWWLLVAGAFVLPFLVHPAILVLLGVLYDLAIGLSTSPVPFLGSIVAVSIAFLALQVKARLFVEEN